MGLMYRPIRICSKDGDRQETAVALIDTGCDETVIKESLAKRLNLESYGKYLSVSASQHTVVGYLPKWRSVTSEMMSVVFSMLGSRMSPSTLMRESWQY